MALLSRPYAYSKIQFEDPEEAQHRRAQFLIHKALQKAETTSSRPPWLRVRVFRMKIKIGKRMGKLRKGFSSTVLSAKPHFCKQIAGVLKSCKCLLYGRHGSVVTQYYPSSHL